MAFFVFSVAIVFHTWLIAVVHNGFMLTAVLADREARPYLDLLNVPGSGPVQPLFWPFAGFLLALTLGVLLKRPKAFFKNLVHLPAWFLACLHDAGRVGMGCLLLFASAALGTGLAVRNAQVLLLLAWLMFLAFGAGSEGLILYALRLVRMDIRRMTGRPAKERERDVARMGLSIFGMGAGFLLSAILRARPVPSGVLAAVFVCLVIVLFLRGRTRPGVGMPMLLLPLAFGLFFRLTMLGCGADDGGWTESDGTLAGWLSSPAAQLILLYGLFPSFMSVFGGLLGLWVASGSNACYGQIQHPAEAIFAQMDLTLPQRLQNLDSHLPINHPGDTQAMSEALEQLDPSFGEPPPAKPPVEPASQLQQQYVDIINSGGTPSQAFMDALREEQYGRLEPLPPGTPVRPIDQVKPGGGMIR